MDKSERYLATGDTVRTISPSRTDRENEPARIVIWDLVDYTVATSIVIPLSTANGKCIRPYVRVHFSVFLFFKYAVIKKMHFRLVNFSVIKTLHKNS